MSGRSAISSGIRAMTRSASALSEGEEPGGRFVAMFRLPHEIVRDESRHRRVPSAMIPISEGPAKTSMPTLPNSIRLASATYLLPGPTITSAGFAGEETVGHGGDRLDANRAS